MKTMLLKIQLNKIKLAYIILGVTQYVVLIFMAILCDRIIELLVLIPLFFNFRRLFVKQYHCESLLKCSFVSIIIFTIVCICMPSNNTSILISVIVSYFITLISYYVKDYIDKSKLLNKKLESLTFEEMKERFTSYSETDLKCVYDYINRGNKSAESIAMKYFYSIRQIQRMVKKLRDDLN